MQQETPTTVVDPHVNLYAELKIAAAEAKRLFDKEQALCEAGGDGTGAHSTLINQLERADAQEWALLRQIVETPAMTPAGLLTQARIVADRFMEPGAWNGDADISAMSNLVEGLSRLASQEL